MSDAPALVPEPELLHGAVVSRSLGQVVIHPDRVNYLSAVQALRDSGFDLCSDLCAVDYLTHPGRPLPPGVVPERFEVV
ncbi:MAG: hypothetical protein ABIW46_07250, partial [Acidimicrobiales bacterium]